MAELQQLTMADLAPLEALTPDDYPERLREIATSLFAHLVDDPALGAVPRPELARMALALTERLSTDLGGGLFYLHKGHAYRLSLRDRQMLQAYTGRNIPELARRYGITETRVRQIVAAWREEEFARSQGQLFSDPAAPSR